MYVRRILGRSAIKACKVLIDPGTLYATVCACDYLCCSVLMKILSNIKMKSFASLGHKEACKLLRLWHVTHHSHSSHSLFSEKPGSPPTLTYIPHWLCLLGRFLHSPVQKGQPWRSPYIGRSHMNLQIFLSLQDPACSIQVVTYPFYDLVTFAMQFCERACGHGIQDNCGITIPKLLRWAIPPNMQLVLMTQAVQLSERSLVFLSPNLWVQVQ